VKWPANAPRPPFDHADSSDDRAAERRRHVIQNHHVRFRTVDQAAASGDVAGVQLHAREALPLAYQIDDLV
jgi:hypothetical protein